MLELLIDVCEPAIIFHNEGYADPPPVSAALRLHGHVDARLERTAIFRERLAESERESARLYRSALNDGWTEAELKKLGITETGPQAARRRSPQTAGETESTNS